MSDASAAARLAEIRESIARAARPARRPPGEVTLVAVSKTQPPEAIVALIEAGQRVFGENRVQEAQAKWAATAEGQPPLRERYPGIELHLVGQLQSNKAEEAVALFDAIHSVDRPSLVAALGKAVEKSGLRPACFIQVNIGDEPQKGGCAVAALPGLLAQAEAAGLPIAGLMCIPPANVEPAPYFALLASLARRHGVTALSMGMSGDFETAVAIGATHVRIGTALFGARA
jgi:pyridoxal phosphate enzyme (YggS family)